MTLNVLIVVLTVESIVYHSLGIYRHVLWIHKRRKRTSKKQKP